MQTLTSLPEIPLPDSIGYPAHVKAAGFFLGAGFTPAEVREAASGSQGVLDAARAMESLLARGVTPQMCAELLGWDAPSARDPWATPGYCSACYQNHPGACGCTCHQPSQAAP